MKIEGNVYALLCILYFVTFIDALL